MSKLLQELADVSDVYDISEVKFGLLNPEALKKASVCHVIVPETYEGSEPKENGLFDTRMGVIERGRICPTDEYDHTITPGYFGHIELPLPVYWVQHMDTIAKLLRCVCIRCANVLFDKSNPAIMKELKKRNGAAAFKWVSDLCSKTSSKKCAFNGGCNAIQPHIYRKVIAEKMKTNDVISTVHIEAEYNTDAFKDASEKKMKFVLPVEHILNIFKRITNENSVLLGFDPVDARPEWMICTVVPVSPPAVRPSVRQDNNQRAEDDLTSKFADIVKSTITLKREIEKSLKKNSDAEREASNRLIEGARALVQYHIATLVDNESKNIPVSTRRSGQPLKMIRQRIRSKDGRIRSNIMGKRVDFSGRTVVDVDPNISIDEYGVPEKIAMNLTIPETVTKYNKTRLYKYVRNGPHVHPGARQIIKMNYDENGIAHQENIFLQHIDRESIVLEEGDIVDRHLIDGDIGLFNRQPSLHRMSMMAHKVKVMPGKTFRLNVYVTPAYNADFDGDEMNTHIPQNIETSNELYELAAVPTQIISPASSTPIIQVKEDTLTAAYLMTLPHIKLSKREFSNLLMTNDHFTGIFPKPQEDGFWRGQDLFSLFLPDISFKKNNKNYDNEPIPDNTVIVENGIFKQGILDKTIIGNTLIQMIYDSYGANAVKDFLDNNQRLLNRWMVGHGFTIGVGDCIPTLEDIEKIKEFIDAKIKDVNSLIKEANIGIFKKNLDNKFIKLNLEADIIDNLKQAEFNFQKYIRKNLNNTNSIYVTMTAGSKGTIGNIFQIRGAVGQSLVAQERINFGYDRRTLPLFSKDDYGARSRGFIANCFYNGLDPIDFFFHQMGGREGVIDTAIKSVSWDTEVVIMENVNPRYVKIGEWIDGEMLNHWQDIDRKPQLEQELLRLNKKTYISTTNDIGCVTWGEVTAVTRHDPGQGMFRITTKSGREVKVVESKSLIIWDNEIERLKEVNTSDVKKGDLLPVTVELPMFGDDFGMEDCEDEDDRESGKFIGQRLGTLTQIPNYILKESKSFMRGFLEGYFEKYGKIVDSVDIVLQRIAGLEMILSYFGIFAEITRYGLVIRGAFARKFADILGLNIGFGIDKTSRWVQKNNIILDPITKIERLNVEDYPKVYDITVPSTLNFGLASGLQVRDTAESGYMQRRLIKALEDLCVKYGGTVRNGMNNIVQFAYGDDGIDPCKLNKQDLKLVEYNNQEMEKKYLITENDMGVLKSIMTAAAFKDLATYLQSNARDDFDNLMAIREKARNLYFKNMNVMSTTVHSPIFFPRTIKNAHDMFKLQLCNKTDLTPQYMKKCLDDLDAELRKYLPEFSLYMFRALLYSHLSVKICIMEYKFNKAVFKFIVDTIREKYLGSLVQPGEMVGVIGAQSMGEPLTQMSVPADTKIMIQYQGRVKKMCIGEFIDDQIKSNHGKISRDQTGKHVIMEIDDKVKILSVSADEKTSWKAISKVSRHPVNGQLMKVWTRSGRMTRATLSHSFLKRTERGIIPIEGSNLKVGDRIPVSNVIPLVDDKIVSEVKIGNMKVPMDFNFGYLWGSYLSKVDVEVDSKVQEYFSKWHNIPEIFFQSNLEFIKGVLSSFVDNDGIIDANKRTLKFCSKNREYLSEIGLLMNYVGIFGILGENDARIKSLSISRKYASVIQDKLQLKSMAKKTAIEEIVRYNQREEIHDLAEYVDKVPEVGNLVADIGKLMRLPDHSRIYGRWRTKESIGRRTLGKYLENFRAERSRITPEIEEKIVLLEQAYYADVIWDEITKIEKYDGEDDEYVYDFTVPGTESFMVDDGIYVHNTLNSVEWNTEIVIDEDGVLVKKRIGEWIDQRIEAAKEENLEHHEKDTVLEYVRDKKVRIEACTKEGKIIWDDVEAVTRHPVHNKDGSKTLLKVTTLGGRVVVATKAKSFLKRVNNEIVGVDGDTIQVGDYLPVFLGKGAEKDEYNTIPDVELSFGKIILTRGDMAEILDKVDYDADLQILETVMNEDVVYDRIMKIEEVLSEHPWVYDLTVKQTRNFNIANGLCMRDTFHNAGTGSVVTSTGVPRIKEIINVSKTIKTPVMEVYLKPQYTESIDKAKMISNQIEFTKLHDIVEKTMIIYEHEDVVREKTEDMEFIQIYQEFAELMGVSQCPDDELSHWVLRIVFNKEKMMNKNIYLSDIQEVISRNSEDDIQCTFSDDNAKELMMRIRVREDSYDGDYLSFLQELEKILMGITIQGIPNIEKVIPQMMKKLTYNADGSYIQSTEWYLWTVGVNLVDVLMNENVDSTRTLSNDINEITEIFGIEATRNIILRELLKMPDYPVNYRHISLLGDIMTHRGVIMKIERHGINRSGERGPIAKATFEESLEILVKASTFGEKDKMGGVSANIMFGQLPKVGTNAFELLFDEGKFITELKGIREKEKEQNQKTSAPMGVIMEDVESELQEYGGDMGEMIDDAFEFTVDPTKNPEKKMTPHAFL
jgi:DNA-directed RNA polymerase beta' subunit